MRSSIRRVWDKSPRQLVHRTDAKIRSTLGATRRSRPPVFVLSTGRVGTMTLAALLDLPSSVLALHEPSPHLYGLGRLAYQADDVGVMDVIREAVRASREEAWRYASSLDRTYVETSPQVTFVARQLLELDPEARFIHLSRDPGPVIRSGLRRGWYTGHPNDVHRIVPRPGTNAAEGWASMEPVEKNAWLWAETNRWIMQMNTAMAGGQWLHLRSEDLVEMSWPRLEGLYEFVGTETPSRRRVAGVISQKLNRQVRGSAASPAEWPTPLRKTVRHLTSDIAEQLGHHPI